MQAGEKTRDYSHEYKLRQKRVQRIHADINKDKVADFKELLQVRGLPLHHG
jgi:hypothetical protein